MGDALVSARAEVDVEPRPRSAGDRSQPPVEVELAGGAAALPPALQREALEIVANACAAGGGYGYPVVDVKVKVLDVQLGEPPDPHQTGLEG